MGWLIQVKSVVNYRRITGQQFLGFGIELVGYLMDAVLGSALPAFHPHLPAGPQYLKPAAAFLTFHHK